MQARDMLLNDAMMTAIRCEMENHELREMNAALWRWLIATNAIALILAIALCVVR